MGCCKSSGATKDTKAKPQTEVEDAYTKAIKLISDQKGVVGQRRASKASTLPPAAPKLVYDRISSQKPTPGKGVQLDNMVYTGLWKDNNAHGQGKLVFKMGGFISGEFKEGKAHGNVVIQDATGVLFVGEIDEHGATGEGVLVNADISEIYMGKFDKNVRTGQGIFQDDVCYHSGHYKDGLKHDNGLYLWKAGEHTLYVGEFLEGKKNGFGRYIWSDGRAYTGKWLDEQMDGYGQFIFPDGRRHEGLYKENMKNGWGEHSWSNGAKYTGGWLNGKYDGYGIFTHESGAHKLGLYKGGNLVEWVTGKDDKIANEGKPDDEISEFKQRGISGDITEDEKAKLANPESLQLTSELKSIITSHAPNDVKTAFENSVVWVGAPTAPTPAPLPPSDQSSAPVEPSLSSPGGALSNAGALSNVEAEAETYAEAAKDKIDEEPNDEAHVETPIAAVDATAPEDAAAEVAVTA